MIGLSTPVSSRRQHDVVGHVDPAAGEVVVPVHPPQVAGVGALRVGVADAPPWSNVDGSASSANVGSVMPRSRNRSTLFGQRVGVDDPVGEPELVLERLRVRVGQRHD